MPGPLSGSIFYNDYGPFATDRVLSSFGSRVRPTADQVCTFAQLRAVFGGSWVSTDCISF